MSVTTQCSGRTVIDISREEALNSFYAAERRAGVDPLLANERLHCFAQRLDTWDQAYERDLAIIRQCLERTS